jgi:hypothetical protein
LYDLSVETSVLSAGILLTVDQDYSTFFILCNSIVNGLTVYNVHVMFEISAKTIYMKKIIVLKPMNVL